MDLIENIQNCPVGMDEHLKEESDKLIVGGTASIAAGGLTATALNTTAVGKIALVAAAATGPVGFLVVGGIAVTTGLIYKFW